MEAVQPTLDFGLQNVRRHGAVLEKFLVKGANIKARAQGFLGVGT